MIPKKTQISPLGKILAHFQLVVFPPLLVGPPLPS